MKDQICVVVEAVRDEVTDLTYSMLAAGRVLAEGLNTGLVALLTGHQVRSVAAKLGAADRVVCVDSPDLAGFSPEAHLRAVAAVLKKQPPRMALFGHTTVGTDLACGVAAQLKAPVVVSCQTFTVEGGQARYSSLICGGRIVATGPLPGPTCVVTVMPGGYKAEQGMADKTPPVETVAAPAIDTSRTSFKAYIEPEATDVDIAKEPVLVSIGRGIQNKDNIALAEELAKLLRGVVCGSRPVVDQGWLPTSRMVGKSGKIVKPKLYLAIGISGAPEHLEGVPDADTMIAINTDAKAPIFDVAKYGTTVDALELLSVLNERIKQG